MGSYRLDRDVDHSIGNIVNDIVITVYGARWALEAAQGLTCNYKVIV